MAQRASDAVVADRARLCEQVAGFSTTVIAPARPGRPYRAFLGIPLAMENAPPVAIVLLCRAQPIPFGRPATSLLRSLARRLSVDLAWRLVHERILADHTKLQELSRVDPVLGVANRTALQEEMARRIPESE